MPLSLDSVTAKTVKTLREFEAFLKDQGNKRDSAEARRTVRRIEEAETMKERYTSCFASMLWASNLLSNYGASVGFTVDGPYVKETNLGVEDVAWKVANTLHLLSQLQSCFDST